MAKKHIRKNIFWIEQNRFLLLLFCTLLVLVLPAFTGQGLVSEFILMITISFLIIQSMNAASVRKSRRQILRFVVIGLIVITWLRPLGIDTAFTEVLKLSCFIAFFVFVVFNLAKFIVSSHVVDTKVLLSSINIYLLAGIIGACLAFILYTIYPVSYNFPAHMESPNLVTFLYYSFVTMSTLGYGDIIPVTSETQTLAYLISVAGQLYVAIIIAIIIGKYLMNSGEGNSKINKLKD